MSISHYPKPEVGMEVYYVPSNSRWEKPCTMKIKKIGRKWATLEGRFGRFDMSTWRVDGGDYSSPATCYPSEDEYNNQKELCRLWDAYVFKLSRWQVPPLATVEKIKQTAELLGIEL